MDESPEGHWAFHAIPDPRAALTAAYQGLRFDLMGMGSRRLNERLDVRAEHLDTADGWHLLLLVTPWCALRVFLPEDPRAPQGLPDADDLECEADGRVTVGAELPLPFQGETRTVEVAFDPRLGHHLVETLAVDMGAFDDTEEALAWARQRPQTAGSASEPTPTPQRQLSRRGLLKGLMGRR